MTEFITLPHVPREELAHQYAPTQALHVPSTSELCQRISDRIAAERQKELYPALADNPSAQALLRLAGIPWVV